MSSRIKIAIIGANEYQLPLIQKANSLGYETHVFAWEDGAIGKDEATKFYPVSIMDKDEILNILKQVQVNGICTAGSDLASITVNYLATHLNLPSNSMECTELTTHKFKMRKSLAAAGLNCPMFYEHVSGDSFDQFPLSFPVIVKPVDRSGSRGITKVNSLHELKFAIERAHEESFINSAIIEEFIEGKEYSIEGISFNGTHKIIQYTRKKTSGSPYFVESGHVAPVDLSDVMREKIGNVVIDSLTSLGITSGASHTEIKITPKNEIFFIEVGARMGGDFIGSHLACLSTGIDFLHLAINCCLGIDIKNIMANKVQPRYSLVRFIFSQEDINSFEKVKLQFGPMIETYSIKDEIQEDINDSSARNGYYIMNISKKTDFNTVLDLTDLEA
ncbi:MAG: ATP-grasp domain-containing protein [Pseudomonadales bacterium]|nr:ATP-grasp domain-containing protein [Pseudomonadales bacterium]